MDGVTLAILIAGGLGLLMAAWRANFEIIPAFGVLFTGWRGDPWPRGVQEEDRDRPWGRAARTVDGKAQPEAVPSLTRVRAHVEVAPRWGG